MVDPQTAGWDYICNPTLECLVVLPEEENGERTVPPGILGSGKRKKIKVGFR